MNIQQLRYLVEVVRNGLNISAAAAALHTVQSGISNQLRLLEDELGIELFFRHGKRLKALTPAGERILQQAQNVLHQLADMRAIGAEYSADHSGVLALATTHTQARYVLPPVIKRFMERYPQVRPIIHQGNPSQIGAMVARGEADIGIATEALDQFEELALFSCYEWNRSIVTPPHHPLLVVEPLTLAAIAHYPIITYGDAFTGRSKINAAFEQQKLTPNIVLTALDADVIKTYINLGLGIGILADMAFDPQRDAPLQARDASHLFASSTTRLALRRGAFLRSYVYTFIEMFAAQLTRPCVEAALKGEECA